MNLKGTFDPTKSYNVNDRERIPALCFAENSRNDKKLATKRQPVNQKRNTLPNINEGCGVFRDRFPIKEVQSSECRIKTLRINPNARYLCTLHEVAIKTKRREDEELQKRRVETLDRYDWDLVKKIGREQPFAKYIESLILKGLSIQSSPDEVSNSLVSRKPPSAMMEFDENIPSKGDQNGLENDEWDSELIVEMIHFLSTSPFRIKSRGAPTRLKFFNDIDHIARSYGRPEELHDNSAEASEFQRVFSDVKELGESIISHEKKLVLDRRSFEIASSIAAAIDAIRKNSRSSKSERKIGKHTTTEVIKDKAVKNKFDEDRMILQRQLLKILAIRNRKKLESTLSLQKMAQTEQAAMKKAEKNLKSDFKSKGPAMNTTHTTNLLKIVENLPQIYK